MGPKGRRRGAAAAAAAEAPADQPNDAAADAAAAATPSPSKRSRGRGRGAMSPPEDEAAATPVEMPSQADHQEPAAEEEATPSPTAKGKRGRGRGRAGMSPPEQEAAPAEPTTSPTPAHKRGRAAPPQKTAAAAAPKPTPAEDMAMTEVPPAAQKNRQRGCMARLIATLTALGRQFGGLRICQAAPAADEADNTMEVDAPAAPAASAPVPVVTEIAQPPRRRGLFNPTLHEIEEDPLTALAQQHWPKSGGRGYDAKLVARILDEELRAHGFPLQRLVLLEFSQYLERCGHGLCPRWLTLPPRSILNLRCASLGALARCRAGTCGRISSRRRRRRSTFCQLC